MTTAVISGPSRGIGREIALRLARRGMDLVLVGRASASMDETMAALGGTGRAACFFDCDVADRDRLTHACEHVLSTVGTPDVVINNAATIHRAPIEELTHEQYDEQLNVNLRAPFVITQRLLPAMRRARRGRLLYVASISSVVGTARSSAYNASKWGLVGLMKCVALELSGTGVWTAAVLPGSVDTRMLAGSGFEPRMTADDVAHTVEYLACDAPSAHNGAIVEMFGT